MKKILLPIFILIANSLFAITYLPEALAFKTTLMQESPHKIQLEFDIAKDYAIYYEQIKISTTNSSSVKLSAPLMPPPILLHNEIIGDYKVYQNKVLISLPVTQTGNGQLTLKLSFQGCKTSSYCYPPIERILHLNINPTNK
ncbi:MAG: protein-disulfide reductase DsbD N-terminal domain-containing protein [Burkholderiales bacterium]|nr:protein-disulfide reductase DsbD N-terminal domain-containing protein [Burkholderiales bacterium]